MIKVAIWGAGDKGNDFLKICDAGCENIRYVFDSNKCKWGSKMETGHRIEGLIKHYMDIDLILVMNKVYFNGISAEIKSVNNEIKVLNLDVYYLLDGYKNIEDYIE